MCHPIEELEESIAAEQIKASLLGSLGPQQRDVVESRFGFHDDEIETLDSIGKRYSVTRERIRQIESTSTKNFEFLYWSAVPWFKEAAWQQASKRFWMGGSIALLILEEPIVNDRVLAALCGVKKAFVAPVRDLLETMCQEATRRVGLYGEPMLPDDWEALLGSATMAPPEVEVEGIAEGDATTGNGPVNEAEVIFEGTG